jgi:hypothetical protein
MRAVLLIAVIVGLFALASARAEPGNREAVMAASHAFDQAQLSGDRAELERYLAPDFRIVYSSGRVGDRAGFIANFTSPALQIAEIRVEAPYYSDLGRDAAIVGGVGIIRGTENGAPFEERFMFADTFVRRDGRWYAVYAQVTPFAAPPAAQ